MQTEQLPGAHLNNKFNTFLFKNCYCLFSDLSFQATCLFKITFKEGVPHSPVIFSQTPFTDLESICESPKVFTERMIFINIVETGVFWKNGLTLIFRT